MNEVLEDKLKNLPKTPGVYMMKDASGKVIYVGKAVALKNRVSQYFRSPNKKDPKTAAMVSEVADFEYILCDTEIEALILECNMIKRYSPYYNILLRDDKHYPYIRIDYNERFPRVCVTRRVKNDGAKYYGPYIASHMLHEILDTVTKMFPIRTCKKDITGTEKSRPCLNYEMGRCLAPCAGKVSEYEYKRMVDEIADFLSGRYKGLEKQLEEEMNEASRNMEYEKAAVIRDRIRSLHTLFEKQKAGFPDLNDKDVFAVYEQDDEAVVQMFLVRKGELNYMERFFMKCAGEGESNVLSYLIKQYYSSVSGIAKQVYVNVEPAEKELIERWLTEKRGSKVQLRVPEKGDNKKLVDMALSNAKEALTRRLTKAQREYDATKGALLELKEALGIESDINRMECYDISNIQGTDSVASMVVFTDGKPDKKEYRRFRIKTVEGADDFASMNEVLTRRLKRGLQQSEGFETMPSLIVVDGGKGQLNAAYDALASLGLEDMPIISLAKREEEVFVPGRSDAVILDRDSNALKLLTRIRDEAHRFAITYHRGLRLKKVEDSVLLKIPYVGEARAKALLRHFDTIGDIKEASFDEILSVEGMDVRSARAVVEYFEADRGE
ncbi:MAG: excinuclease ABC subunit UvrC [Burkholderiales bacterium]